MKELVLSVQSQLAYGFVGNNIAKLILQLQGIEVIAIPTVLYSNHTGHKEVYGSKIPKELFDDLVKGIDVLRCFESINYMISGYIGDKDIVDSTFHLVKKMKENNPESRYVFDPVMGDNPYGLFLQKELADYLIEKLLPECDILTPNHFELEYILGKKINNIDQLEKETSIHPILKNKTIIVTSCILEDCIDNNIIETVVVTPSQIERIHSPKIHISTVGTGDLFAAATVGQLYKGKDIYTAIDCVSKYVSSVMHNMNLNGDKEINLDAVLESLDILNK